MDSHDRKTDHKLTSLLDRFEQASESGSVTVADILHAAGSRSFAPALLLPAVIADIPIIGAIPGISILAAMWMLLISVQLLLYLPHPWLPRAILCLQLQQNRLVAVTYRVRPWARRAELLLKPRLGFLFEGPFRMFLALICIFQSALMLPLAFIPYGVTLPATALLLIALALLTRDGLTALLGYTLSAISVALIFVAM